jgi:hypothetical protein
MQKDHLEKARSRQYFFKYILSFHVDVVNFNSRITEEHYLGGVKFVRVDEI